MIRIFLTIFLATIAFSSTAQLTETLAQEQIKLVMKFQESNWNNGNIAAYMEGYWKSDSLLFIGKKGPAYGWETTLENYLKSYPDKASMGKLKFELIKVDILSETTAFVAGKWSLERTALEDLNGFFTLSWKKINEQWKIVADHSSSSD